MTRKIKASNIATSAVTAAILDNSGVTAGSYGSSTAIPVLTVNAKGQVTVASTASLPANLATETYVSTAISNLVDAAPSALNTLNELAAALGDDANYASTITTALGTKLATADFASTFDTRLGTKSTSNLTEGTNLYYTNARARSSISAGSGLSYDSSTGVFTSTVADATNASNISSGTLNKARLPGGVVLQVEQAIRRDAFTMGTSDWTTITSFNGTITPTRSTSRILVDIFIGRHDAGSNGLAFRILRNGTVIDGALGDGAGSRDRATTGHMGEGDNNHTRSMATIVYLDSPATTSAVTYSIQVKTEGNSTYFFNRAQVDTDLGNAYGARCISTITMTEVA